ncbi:hypothetical protein GEMRC1_009617 [Eukaryota sp. GEM-RC1]
MGRDYLTSIEEFERIYLDEPKEVLITSTIRDVHGLQGGIMAAVVDVSFTVAPVVVLTLIVYIMFTLTPVEKLASHVKQIIRLVTMEKFHNQSLYALS